MIDEASSPVLAVRGLEHAFGERRVLAGVSLELAPGEVLGLLGPNGSGKSTLLGVLSGSLRRQVGEVAWRGRPLHRAGRDYRQAIGVVCQSPSLDPKLTARQNLVLAAVLHGLGRAEGCRRAPALLEAAGLADRADEPVKTFSGGMKRRLDLARALLTEPQLLFMDEPTSGLDEGAFRETWARLERLREGRAVSVLVATHRADEAERCDRVAVISDGLVAACDTPESLRTRVARDVVVLEGDEPHALVEEVSSRFAVSCLVHGDAVVVDCDRGHEPIPRLVEAFPAGRLRSVSLRRPTLADVFLKVTGHVLHEDLQEEAA